MDWGAVGWVPGRPQLLADAFSGVRSSSTPGCSRISTNVCRSPSYANAGRRSRRGGGRDVCASTNCSRCSGIFFSPPALLRSRLLSSAPAGRTIIPPRICDDHSLRHTKNLETSDEKFTVQVHDHFQNKVTGPAKDKVRPPKLSRYTTAGGANRAKTLKDGFLVTHYAGEVMYSTGGVGWGKPLFSAWGRRADRIRFRPVSWRVLHSPCHSVNGLDRNSGKQSESSGGRGGIRFSVFRGPMLEVGKQLR